MDRVTAVVPVKALCHAKTRLDLPVELRRSLALGFADDTVGALLRCPVVAGVVVVTSDPVVGRHLRCHPVRVVPDPGRGLGVAVLEGARSARAWHPGAGVLVTPADLPCLRPEDVATVVGRTGSTPGAFVPDRAATGTTLLVHPAGRPVTACYGVGSAARHRALGLVPLLDAPVGARHDVDTVEDLRAAIALGTGRATAAAVAAGGLTPRWLPTP